VKNILCLFLMYFDYYCVVSCILLPLTSPFCNFNVGLTFLSLHNPVKVNRLKLSTCVRRPIDPRLQVKRSRQRFHDSRTPGLFTVTSVHYVCIFSFLFSNFFWFCAVQFSQVWTLPLEYTCSELQFSSVQRLRTLSKYTGVAKILSIIIGLLY